uniref:Uncharacterized protein n=1 Tax=Picea glauca TaxID=3330 RepID=A0A124GNS8_PICGL|nr:hypothetical protein ABT39_MTgene3015 [Picea glauca]QHR91918.1 hypothetical protein Q903MT_gene5954 [Picea sitchensis]
MTSSVLRIDIHARHMNPAAISLLRFRSKFMPHRPKLRLRTQKQGHQSQESRQKLKQFQ